LKFHDQEERMLVAIETYFLKALKSVFPTGTTVTMGPAAIPGTSNVPLVEIVASRFSFVPEKTTEENSDEPPGRSPAFELRVQSFPTDGTMRDFVLPADATGEIVEVQAPPGRLLTRGDDYQIDGRTIRFYRAPAKATIGVSARLRGARVRGYQQRFAGQADVNVRIWTSERVRTDELSRTALATVLIAAENVGVLDASDPKTPSVTMRLLRASASLTAIRRNFESSFHTAVLEIVLRGELEQTVMLGAPEPEGIIREVLPA
jgi:hypothetical protein